MTTQTQSRWRTVVREWLPMVVLILFILIARSTLADHYHVPSSSMEHALLPGDHVAVNKAAYGLRVPFTKQVVALVSAPQRGDVVIFDSPHDGVRLIKRVVAVGGDVVAVKQGRVAINGKYLASPAQPTVEKYDSGLVYLNLSKGGGPDLPAIKVPDQHVLVLGDYRGNSRDGRYFGTVPFDELYGKASGVFWRSGDGPVWKNL